MEKKVNEVHENVLEVQTTYKFILKRLNQIQQNASGTQCHCGSAARLQNNLSEIATLTSRVHVLEEEDRQRDELLTSLLGQLKSLQNLFEQVKRSKQTDNVKLKISPVSPDQDKTRDDVETTEEQTCDTAESNVENITSATQDGDISHTVEHVDTASVTDNTEATCTSKNEHTQSRKLVTFNEKVTQKLLEADGKTGDSDRCEGGGNEADVSNTVETVSLNDTLLGATGGRTGKTRSLQKLLRSRHRSPHKKRSDYLLAKSIDEHNPDITSDIPEVVVQKQTKRYDDLSEWEHLAAIELQAGMVKHVKGHLMSPFNVSAWDSGLLSLGGVHSILLIDISESIIPVWDQVKQFFNDYISGLEASVAKMDIDAEYVAIVTFGHETKVQMRLTNDFSALRQCFRGLKLGGPSPMSGGINMTHVAIGAADGQYCKVNDILEPSKVVLITDGYPTHPLVFAGPDKPDEADTESGREQVIKTYEDFGDTGFDLYTVPVGNADMEFLNKLTSAKCGKMLDYKSGHQLSRRFYLMYNTLPLSLSLGLPVLTDGEELSDADKKDLEGIKERLKKTDNSTYHEETGGNVPVIGSRVRRGPDWEYDDQDSGGPGTLIGHTVGGKQCFVNWDLNGTIDVYKYGANGKYDLTVVEEQRYLQPGEYIAVGCMVKPGVSWKSSFDDVSNEDLRGVVLRLTLEDRDIPKALVRWHNGKRGLYTYAVDQNPEIVVCYEVLQQRPPQPVRKTTRNKNKNVR